MSVALKVKIFDRKGTRVVQVPRSTLTIGSAPHCDVVIEHSTVAAEHARGWLEGGRIWVQDLGTNHGTTLNDVRLPALKPMLVRDLDVLKLGDSDATLGLEALLVRAPVVKATVKPEPVHHEPPAPAPTASRAPSRSTSHAPNPAVPPPVPSAAPVRETIPDVEVSRRREEAEALGRELAELRLQLQMGQLEKSSSQELSQQLTKLREEIKIIQEQKAKWNETLRQMEAEKNSMRKNVESDLADFKAKSIHELHAVRDKDLQKFEVWKGECILELKKHVRALSEQKARLWATRPISKDMLLEWESDLTAIFKGVILNAADEFMEVTGSQPKFIGDQLTPLPQPKATPPQAHAHTGTHTRSHTKTHTKSHTHSSAHNPVTTQEMNALVQVKKSEPDSDKPVRVRSSSRRRRWQRVTVSSFFALLAIIGLYLGISYLRKPGNRSLSSQMPISPAPPMPVQAAPPPPMPMQPRPVVRFQPKQGKKYRANYTDNVLYLENYVAAEENIDFRKKWMNELNKVAATDWKLDPWTVTALVAKEQVLVQDLNRIKDGINPGREQDGINQMRAREAQFLRELDTTLKSRAYVDRFLKYKRNFYVRNQAYLAKSN